MKYAMIATWKMAFEGVSQAKEILENKGNIKDAIVNAICNVENNPNFRSVGYGGLPNVEGEVELDSAYMDGNDLSFGAICSVKNIKNPIKVACKLSEFKRNCYLSGKGAEKFAQLNKFEFTNMLTEESFHKWEKKRIEDFEAEKTEAYGGHDTVCMIGLDQDKNMSVGVSTSGLFMKHPGRVGDSPVIGSGFYCDSYIGGAAATGVGEDIMKGCLSIEIVNRMRNHETAQEACENALKQHYQRMNQGDYKTGSMSVIALDKDGNFGAATTKKEFPFVVMDENKNATIMVCQNNDFDISVFEADENWLLNYVGD